MNTRFSRDCNRVMNEWIVSIDHSRTVQEFPSRNINNEVLMRIACTAKLGHGSN